MANGYHVKKHGSKWGAFQKNILLALYDTKAEADRAIADFDDKKNPKNFEFAQVEKGSRVKLKEFLDDGWEPYAVDEQFHYLKK